MEENLFSEFSPVNKAQWRGKIIEDIKGADFDKKLIWHTGEGFDVQPFYTPEDLTILKYLQTHPGKFPFVRGNKVKRNLWKVNQLIRVTEIEKAHHEALNAIKNGVDSLTLNFDKNPDFRTFEKLFDQVDGEKTELNFKAANSLELPALIEKLAKKHSWETSRLKGSIHCDPLSTLTLNGTAPEFSKAESLLKIITTLPAFHCITIDAEIFHNSGGSIVSEMAFALSTGNAYMQYFTEKGFEARYTAYKMHFNFATGSNYFMEIAKIRAFRYLWAKILQAYGLAEKDSTTYIHTVNSFRNKTVYDPYVNMLRTTTETMSASLGGADSITVLPYDTVFEEPYEAARRVARNQQAILREESFFNKVADPAAGSYYIENLTHNLIQKAWGLFLEVEETGGYEEAFKHGFIQKHIRKEAITKDLKIAQRKQVILGVNQFPNPQEHLQQDFPDKVFSTPEHDESGEIQPLKPYRAAAAFESLRRQTDLFSMKNKRPAVWLFTYGDLSKRHARAQFAGNFFACAGYEIIDHPGFSTLEEGIAAAQNDKPEIVVLCSSDEEYETIAIPVFEALNKACIVVLAGYPQKLFETLKTSGIQYFIHTKSNVLEDLKKYQHLLRI